MLNLENKPKFQKDILNQNVTIYPLVVIDEEINISTVSEVLLNNEDDKNPIEFKDYALKISNIKEAVNVKEHKFKISNLTLKMNNYSIEGKRLSDLLVKKFNKNLIVYFKTQSCNYLSDCLLVYRGIIRRFTHDESVVSLTVEDLTEKTVHKDLPSANMGNGSNCLNKDYIDQYIPMTYGNVRRAPMMPYLVDDPNSSESFLYMLPDDIDTVTSSDRNICIEGFSTNPEDSDSLNFVNPTATEQFQLNPLLIYKDDYFRVLKNYDSRFDRLETETDTGYPTHEQYYEDATGDYIHVVRDFWGGHAKSPAAIGDLQTIKVWHPENMTILSELGETTIEGAGNSSAVNLNPDGGILRPEAGIDSIERASIYNNSLSNYKEFDSYAQIPNNQPTVLNSYDAIDEIIGTQGYRVNLLKPYVHHHGLLFPEDEGDRSIQVHYWKMVANWLLLNAHHFRGRIRFIQHPSSHMVMDKAWEKICENNSNININEKFMINSLQLAFQYNLWNYTGTPYYTDWNQTEDEFKWKNAWKNACGLSGNETSNLDSNNLTGHSFWAAGGNNNYYDNNYQLMYQNRTVEYDPVTGFNSLLYGFEMDNLSRIFDGSLGNGGDGATCYAPALIHKIPCDINHPNNPDNIKTIYIGQWNPDTMQGVTLSDGEVWFDVFNQDNEMPFVSGYLYEKNDFCSFFPAEQKNKRYIDYHAYAADYSAIWNGVPINSYQDRDGNNAVTTREFPLNNWHEIFHTDLQFERNFGMLWNDWHSATKQGQIFHHEWEDYKGQSWAIYIEDDIVAGEVLRKMSQLEYQGEYFHDNTRTHISKGSVLPLTSRFPFNLHWGQPADTHDIFMDEGYSAVNTRVTLVQGTDTVASERLVVTFPLTNITSKDSIKTKTYAYGKFSTEVAADYSNLDATDNFLVDAVAVDILNDEEEDFLALVDPDFGVNLMNIRGDDESFSNLFIDSTVHEWDCRPNIGIPDNQFQADDDDAGGVTKSLTSYEISSWDSPDAFNGISLVYKVHSENPQIDKYAQMSTKINTFGLLQFNIFEKVYDDKFYADVRGRANSPYDVVINEETGITESKYIFGLENPDSTKIMIENPCDIMYHIIEKELNQIDVVDRNDWAEQRSKTRGIKLAFSVTEKIKSKKLIEDLSKHSTYYTKFKSTGGFSYNIIENTYNSADATIKSDDLIKIQFSRTNVENIHTMVNVKYNKDYATDSYSSETGYCDGYDFFGNGENDSDVLMSLSSDGVTETKKGYDYSSLGLKREEKILEFESDYIRDSASAKTLRNYIYMLNCNQHTIIKCTLTIKDGIMFETGDIVRFDKLYNNMKAFGEDYTIPNERNGQTIYPYFIITSCTKSSKDVKIECFQLHSLVPTFFAGKGSVSRKSQVGIAAFPIMGSNILEGTGVAGEYNIDYSVIDEGVGLYDVNGHITFEDIRMLEDIVSGSYKYVTSKQFIAGDVANSRSIDEYSIYVLSTLYGHALLPENLNFGDINNDGQINVIDVTNLYRYIIGIQSPQIDTVIAELHGDVNQDGNINVVDIVNLINQILGI